MKTTYLTLSIILGLIFINPKTVKNEVPKSNFEEKYIELDLKLDKINMSCDKKLFEYFKKEKSQKDSLKTLVKHKDRIIKKQEQIIQKQQKEILDSWVWGCPQ